MRYRTRLATIFLAVSLAAGVTALPAAATPEGDAWFLLDKDVSTETSTNPCTGLEHDVTFDFEDWVRGTSDAYVLQSWWSIETSDGYSAPFKHVYQETFNARAGATTFTFTANNTNVNDEGDRFRINVRFHATMTATGVTRVIDDAAFVCLGAG